MIFFNIKLYRLKKGFTLVEIMIVLAILSLIFALIIPNFLRARIIANEAAAIANLKIIGNACLSYFSAASPASFPPDLATLSAAVPPYIDISLAGAQGAGSAKQGYFFTYTRTNLFQFTCTATPANNATGHRIFFINESGTTRLNNESGPPINQ